MESSDDVAVTNDLGACITVYCASLSIFSVPPHYAHVLPDGCVVPSPPSGPLTSTQITSPFSPPSPTLLSPFQDKKRTKDSLMASIHELVGERMWKQCMAKAMVRRGGRKGEPRLHSRMVHCVLSCA